MSRTAIPIVERLAHRYVVQGCFAASVLPVVPPVVRQDRAFGFAFCESLA
ncbi:MAG: hypothetical protein AB7G15_12495 [Alphaproteobacteria bacterium]